MPFENQIKPFLFCEHVHDDAHTTYSLILNVGTYKAHIFATRAKEGFWGNGYDWASLANTFLESEAQHLMADIKFDPEADMFCAYSQNKDALQAFALKFHALCEDEQAMASVFATAYLD